MDSNIMGKAMLLTFAGMGIKIDNINETTDNLTLYISVPKDADDSIERDVNGYVMAGEHLAKTVKRKLTAMGIKRLTVKYKIRDEVWNKSMREAAETEMKKELFRSQW